MSAATPPPGHGAPPPDSPAAGAPLVEVRALRRLDDERGWFLKAIQAHHLEGHAFGEAYLSAAGPGATRGAHYHKRTTEWFCPVLGRGTLYIAAADGERRSSVRFDAAAPVSARVPAGVAHALVADPDCELVVLAVADVEYDPADTDTFPVDLERIRGRTT